MSKKNSQVVKASAGNSAKPDPFAQSHAISAQRTLEEIQLARLGDKLRNFGNDRDLIRALGKDPDEYASRLVKQYADLGTKLRQPISFAPGAISPRLAGILGQLGNLFGSWSTVTAPLATVGIVQTPGSSGEYGPGIGAAIYEGELALGGQISNPDLEEQWWVNTWQCIVPFPTTPFYGSLTYRFNLGATLDFYMQAVLTGSVHIYVTVATTNDLAHQPINFTQPASSQFAVVATLPVAPPAPGAYPTLGGGVSVTGTIPVLPGATPAIGILIGLVVSIADGALVILTGESFIDLTPPDATMPSDLGKIEYLVDPEYWVVAVGQMFSANEQLAEKKSR